MMTTNFDPSVAQDNTGRAFALTPKAASRRNAREAEKLFRNPAALACPNCHTEDRFRIHADDCDGSELVQFVCSKCNTYWMPVELRKPQIDDYRARNVHGPSGHNLWLPNTYRGVPRDDTVCIEFDIDMED
jgi:hypothetical protein